MPARIPLPIKLTYTTLVAVLIPFYWDFYGVANFLWLCDIALLTTVVALWLESSFLASMQLVAILLPSCIWLADFMSRLITGHFLTRWTHYMFRDDIPLVIRGLSLYHGFLFILLFWLVRRLGYDRRGWLAQTSLVIVLLPICYFFTDPVRALNGVFGPSGGYPQNWIDPFLYLLLMMAFYPIAVFFPAHWILNRTSLDKSAI